LPCDFEAKNLRACRADILCSGVFLFVRCPNSIKEKLLLVKLRSPLPNELICVV
jgi:hypothetical protein